ncbi:MAG: glycoside hydrolase family 97 N-terminal domain-containing protein, partial [Bacteroidota bacterium]|nr:glycoside hydrolase family 97 N-terminal domain-containing protein [Bacteroidota bacterium]
MKKIYIILIISIFASSAGCGKYINKKNIVLSPSNKISIEFLLNNNGTPNYIVLHKNNIAIDTSKMGFDFKELESMQNGFKINDIINISYNNNWEMPWGEQRIVDNHYNEMIIKLEEDKAPNRKLNIYFRAYDDGIGFRYEFPEQKNIDSLIILDENTQFNLTGNHTCWWI